MQSTVAPLNDDFSPDLPTVEELVEFHARTGAVAIAWPHHRAESLNLTIAERKPFAEVTVKVTAGRVRADFQIMSATDFMVSSGAIGATTMLSPLAGVAPKLMRRLYDLCKQDKYFDAHKAQEQVAARVQAVKAPGLRGLKGAVGAMARECGNVRVPNTLLGDAARDTVACALKALPALAGEPRGW